MNNKAYRNSSDSAWKQILDHYCADFLALCLPKIHALIDWTKPIEPLDKELQAVTKDDVFKPGKRLADKLIKVFLKNGQEEWILIHIEVEGSGLKEFGQRMLFYITRLYDKYQKPIVSCAILTDERKNFRLNKYEVNFGGCKLSVEYLIVKLTDYVKKREKLKASNNPFASVILIQLIALEAKHLGKPAQFDVKCQLTRSLYEKGFSKQQIIDLYRFIDWLIHLTEKDELTYKQYVFELEEKTKMAYVSTIERAATQQGIQQGIQQGEELLLVRQLNCKFGKIPSNYRERIREADAEMLTIWGVQLMKAKTLEEVFI